MRRIICYIAAAALAITGAASYAEQYSLEGDIVAPQIDHSPPSEVSAHSLFRIYARVTDNLGVSEVLLFYRYGGSAEYQRIPMQAAPGQDMYVADLTVFTADKVEYYIRACDMAQNCTMSRTPYDPVVVAVVAPAASDVEARPEPAVQEARERKKGVSKWVWVGLGAVAIAGLAMGGGGGGGDSAAPATASIQAPIP
jgi:hypothetical protein